VAVSDVLAAAVQQFTDREVHIVPNHVHLESAVVAPEAPEARGEDPLKLVAVGNVIHHKGPILAVETVRELRERGIRAALTWVGTGPLLEEVRSRASGLGVSDAISLPGQVSPEQIPAVLREAHVFMLPTVSETFGVAFAEALGQGLPIVATGYGGHLGFLPEAASRIAKERTASSLADAVESLISDEERWTAGEILEHAHLCFSEETRRTAYSAIYAGLWES